MLTEQVFVRSTWTRGQDLAGQARRSHWRTCSVPSQRNVGNQLAIPEQLTLQVALYIHDIVVRNGEPRRYSIIEKRMVISGTWSRKIATKNSPPLVTDHSSDQFPSQQKQKNMDKGRQKKGLGDGCSVDLGGSMCRWEILFGVKQTTTYESWQLFKNAVRPMWWLRALGCAKDDGE